MSIFNIGIDRFPIHSSDVGPGMAPLPFHHPVRRFKKFLKEIRENKAQITADFKFAGTALAAFIGAALAFVLKIWVVVMLCSLPSVMLLLVVCLLGDDWPFSDSKK